MVDLFLHNGTIYTLEQGLSTASAIAIKAGEVARVGSDADVLKLRSQETRVVDLAGRTVLPGLCDAHCHVRSLGQREELVDLGGVPSYEELIVKVENRAEQMPKGEWVAGRGWNEELWPDRKRPTHHALSTAVPDHPVWLTRVDGHAGLANATAMAEAGIGPQAQSPPGGLIMVEGGAATGVFLDRAMDMFRQRIRTPDLEQVKRHLLRAQEMCLSVGLTEVHDAGISEIDLDAYRSLTEEGKLKIRVYAMLRRDFFDQTDVTPFEQGRLTVRSVKIVLDGALGSRGAALFEPYSDAPDLSGLLLLNDEELDRTVQKAARTGFQLYVHAIGDRANSVALDALPESTAPTPGDYRSRLEHAQIMRPNDIERMARLGVIASVQQTHATSDMNMAEDRLGPTRILGAYAWRKMLSAGAHVAGGSDFPVEGHDPLWGLYAAVTRQDHSGEPAGGWTPGERMTIEEALRSFTTETAYAAFREDRRGTLTPGMWADLVVQDQDVVTGEPRDMLDTRVLATVIGGEVVYGSLS